MKNLFAIFYAYDLEMIDEANESWKAALDRTKNTLRNSMAMLYIYDRQVIEEAEDSVVAALCGKPA
jgi:hypothetical protein